MLILLRAATASMWPLWQHSLETSGITVTRFQSVIRRVVEIRSAFHKWISVYLRTPHRYRAVIQVLLAVQEELVLRQLTLLKWWWLAWLVVPVPVLVQVEAHQVALLLQEVNHNLDQQGRWNTQPSLATRMRTSEAKAMDYTTVSLVKRNSSLSVIPSAKRAGLE